MAFLDGIERLINEHGSAVILKERIALANDKHSMLEDKIQALESENKALLLDLNNSKLKIKQLQELVSNVNNTNPEGYVCDHCGNGALKRTGSRPDPTFGVLGIKQKVFSCNSCGKESAFTPEDK